MRPYIPFLGFLSLLAVILAVCLPVCNQPSTVAPVDAGDCDAGSCALPIPLAPRTEYSQENWRFTVPGEGWISGKPRIDELKLMAMNENNGAIVILLKESTTDTFAQYVVGTIRDYSVDGNVISSAKQVVINGNKYVEAQVNTENTIVWSWITVKDGFGYSLGCGGGVNPDGGSSLYDLCQDFAHTIELQ